MRDGQDALLRCLWAVKVILDSQLSRSDRGFCLSCHLYTRRLSDLELGVLLDYFVRNGFPGSVITDPNEFGKRFIFLKESV